MTDIPNLDTRWEKGTNELILKLLEKGINFSNLKCLEIFGRDGTWHVSIFAKLVKSMEIWEIDEKWKKELEKNFPKSEIKIIDSVKIIKSNLELPKIDLLLIDNPMNVYGNKNLEEEKYCEHFDIIDKIKRFCNEKILVVFNVNRCPFNYNLYSEWKERREDFYKNSQTHDLTITFLHKFYQQLFEKLGFDVIFKINVTRVFFNNIDMTHYFAYYLQLK
tara:strand:+ start:121 stop:777 length:657 start_codon:yes stop_codon:yes gene_type:complete